jgi:hypothetical protein
VNVTTEGDVKNMLSPVILTGKVVAPKEVELQKPDPLHETTRLGYVTDVAVFEIGESKSCRDCGPAAAKYAVSEVYVIVTAPAGPALTAIRYKKAAQTKLLIVFIADQC